MANLKRVILKETETDRVDMSEAAVEQQLSKFDTSYTSKKLNDLYNEFDSITFNDEQKETTIVKNNAVDVQVNPSFKVKVYLTTAIIITCLLAFLAIYNIFVINDLNVGIKMLQENVAQSEVTLNSLQAQVSGMSEEELKALITETFGGEYASMAANGYYEIPNLTVQTTSQVQADTNWFDGLCSFVSNVFGG